MAKSKIRIFRDKTLVDAEKLDKRIYFKYYEQNSEGFYGINVNGKIINVKNSQYADLVTTDNDGNWIIPIHIKKTVPLEYNEAIPEEPAYYMMGRARIQYDGPTIKDENDNIVAEVPNEYYVKRTFITDNGNEYLFNEIKDHYEVHKDHIYYTLHNITNYDVYVDNNEDELRYYYLDDMQSKTYINIEDATKVYKISEIVNNEITFISKELFEDVNGIYYLSGTKIYLSETQQDNIEYIYTIKNTVYTEIVDVKFEIEVILNDYPEYISTDELNEFMSQYSLIDLVSSEDIIFKTTTYGSQRYKMYPRIAEESSFWSYYDDTKGEIVKLYENPDNLTSIEIDAVSSIIVTRYPAITSRYVYTDENSGVEYVYLGDISLLTIEDENIYIDVYYDNQDDPATYYVERFYNGNKIKYYIF